MFNANKIKKILSLECYIGCCVFTGRCRFIPNHHRVITVQTKGDKNTKRD